MENLTLTRVPKLESDAWHSFMLQKERIIVSRESRQQVVGCLQARVGWLGRRGLVLCNWAACSSLLGRQCPVRALHAFTVRCSGNMGMYSLAHGACRLWAASGPERAVWGSRGPQLCDPARHCWLGHRHARHHKQGPACRCLPQAPYGLVTLTLFHILT